MDEIRIIILAIIQGITEFLPISSSGHLVLFENLFGLSNDDILIEVILHFGTLISILIYFREDILDILTGVLKGDKDCNTYIANVFIATIPVVLCVLLFRDSINSIFSTKVLLYTYVANMIILYFLAISAISCKLLQIVPDGLFGEFIKSNKFSLLILLTLSSNCLEVGNQLELASV